MVPYSRRTPRSLRLRFGQLRHYPLQLAQVAAALRGIAGVCAVDVSPINGSVLIHYDACATRNGDFWNEIAQLLSSYQLQSAPLRNKTAPRPCHRSDGAAHAPHAPNITHIAHTPNSPHMPQMPHIQSRTRDRLGDDSRHGPAFPAPALAAVAEHGGAASVSKLTPRLSRTVRAAHDAQARSRSAACSQEAYPARHHAFTGGGHACTGGAALGRTLASGVIGTLRDKLLERCALALFAALL